MNIILDKCFPWCMVLIINKYDKKVILFVLDFYDLFWYLNSDLKVAGTTHASGRKIYVHLVKTRNNHQHVQQSGD